MTSDKREARSSTWYREPYVWLVILFPAIAVIGGIVTVILAINSDDGLVVDDYYKQGLAINRTLERDRAAESNGLQADIVLLQEHNSVRISLNADNNFEYPDRLMVSFLHSTRSGFDHKVFFTRIADGRYEAELPGLIPGKWYVQIESGNWRLLESLSGPL